MMPGPPSVRPLALVTGASRGIGREMSLKLAARGYDLVLVARSREELLVLALELETAFGASAQVVDVDLTSSDAAPRIFEAVGGRALTLLANNAGFGTHGDFVWLARTDLQRELDMVQVNVSSLLHLTGLFLPGMVEQGVGHVLNVSSTASFQPGPGMATYYATKAFVTSFSEALAHELRGTGVTVTAHCPGPVATDFARVAATGRVRFNAWGLASAEHIAEHALVAAHAGRVVSIPGLMNFLMAQSLRFTPRAVVRAVAAWANRQVG